MDETIANQKFKEKFGDNPTYEMAKPWLYPRLMRKALVDCYPHDLVCISRLDFFITFFVLIDEGDDSLASFPVTMEIMDDWEVTSEELLNDAVKNAEKLFPATIESIESTLELSEDEFQGATFYVLSNSRRHFGAGGMLYENVLSDFEDRIDEPFFIIPSSVHEVLLIPCSMNMPVEDLKAMLLDVNDSIVSAEDILGSHIYYFDHDKGLVFADEAPEASADTGEDDE